MTHYGGFWEYWLLYHKVTFDGINKLILINPGETFIDVKADIYSAWKEWILLSSHINAKYPAALSVIGGEPLVGSEKLDSTFFLINDWKIKPYSGFYSLNLQGNLFSEDGGSIQVPADFIENQQNNITINLQTSAVVRQVESTNTITGSGGIVTASLIESQALQLTNIETISDMSNDLLITQSLLMSNMKTMLDDLYSIHGLRIGFPVKVTHTDRTIIGDTLFQSIQTVGSGSVQETVIERLT